MQKKKKTERHVLLYTHAEFMTPTKVPIAEAVVALPCVAIFLCDYFLLLLLLYRYEKESLVSLFVRLLILLYSTSCLCALLSQCLGVISGVLCVTLAQKQKKGKKVFGHLVLIGCFLLVVGGRWGFFFSQKGEKISRFVSWGTHRMLRYRSILYHVPFYLFMDKFKCWYLRLLNLCSWESYVVDWPIHFIHSCIGSCHCFTRTQFPHHVSDKRICITFIASTVLFLYS